MKLKRWMVIAIAMLLFVFHHHTTTSFEKKHRSKEQINPIHASKVNTDFDFLSAFMLWTAS